MDIPRGIISNNDNSNNLYLLFDMIPQNLKIIELSGAEGTAIGLYLTTRDDIEDFQRFFDVVSEEAHELEESEKAYDPEWDIRTYIDTKLSEVYGIHREFAEEVTTNIL